MTAALQTQALGKTYGRRWALTDCTLDIPAGRVVGLVGPNGAGKTTLLNLAVGQPGAIKPMTSALGVRTFATSRGPVVGHEVGHDGCVVVDH